jgi:hypothetical protein
VPPGSTIPTACVFRRMLFTVPCGIVVTPALARQQGGDNVRSTTSPADRSAAAPRTQAEKDAIDRRRKAECLRLYAMLGDRSLTPQQVEAIRVSMNAHLCAGLAP